MATWSINSGLLLVLIFHLPLRTLFYFSVVITVNTVIV